MSKVRILYTVAGSCLFRKCVLLLEIWGACPKYAGLGFTHCGSKIRRETGHSMVTCKKSWVIQIYSLVKERKTVKRKCLTHSAQKLVQTYLIIFLKPKMFLMLRKLTAEKSVKNFHNKIDNFCKMLMKLKINLSQPTIFLKRWKWEVYHWYVLWLKT